jgi:hypothetical protein
MSNHCLEWACQLLRRVQAKAWRCSISFLDRSQRVKLNRFQSRQLTFLKEPIICRQSSKLHERKSWSQRHLHTSRPEWLANRQRLERRILQIATRRAALKHMLPLETNTTLKEQLCRWTLTEATRLCQVSKTLVMAVLLRVKNTQPAHFNKVVLLPSYSTNTLVAPSNAKPATCPTASRTRTSQWARIMNQKTSNQEMKTWAMILSIVASQ